MQDFNVMEYFYIAWMWHEGKFQHIYESHVPTRLHGDGPRGQAGADAIVVADSDGVEMATLQVGYPAAGARGAAAEKSLIFIHDGGGVGVNSGLATPRNQSLIGCTVQGGRDAIRWASSWNETTGKLNSRLRQNIIRLWKF